MPGRVTQNMMNAQMLRNLNYNLSQMDKLQNQMATGRRINKPSDDPVGISFSMRYRSELSANDQYEKNVDNAISWLDFTDAMLDQATQIIQRVRELAVNGANSTNPPDAMNAIRSEIIQLREQMVTVANSQFNGKYIFNGEKTDVKPYVDDAANPAASAETDGGKIHFEIGVGADRSVPGRKVPDMAVAGQHLEVAAKILVDRFGFRRGFDDDQIFARQGDPALFQEGRTLRPDPGSPQSHRKLPMVHRSTMRLPGWRSTRPSSSSSRRTVCTTAGENWQSLTSSSTGVGVGDSRSRMAARTDAGS